MGDRKQSAKNRCGGGSRDVVPNGWPTDPNLERGRRHTPLSNTRQGPVPQYMCVALLRPTSQSCGAAETVAVLNMRALAARLAQGRESNLRERQLKKLTLLCLLPFQFLRSQTREWKRIWSRRWRRSWSQNDWCAWPTCRYWPSLHRSRLRRLLARASLSEQVGRSLERPSASSS
jgi:hypothetical protein